MNTIWSSMSHLLAQTFLFTHLYLTLFHCGIPYLMMLLAYLPLIVLLCITFTIESDFHSLFINYVLSYRCTSLLAYCCLCHNIEMHKVLKDSCHAIPIQRIKPLLHCAKHVTTLSCTSVTNCFENACDHH